MCAACSRSTWLLALMKSADRLPYHSSALNGARAPWVLPIPGSRPVRHHISPLLHILPRRVIGEPDLGYAARAT
jgi:hypothetical protein